MFVNVVPFNAWCFVNCLPMSLFLKMEKKTLCHLNQITLFLKFSFLMAPFGKILHVMKRLQFFF